MHNYFAHNYFVLCWPYPGSLVFYYNGGDSCDPGPR